MRPHYCPVCNRYHYCGDPCLLTAPAVPIDTDEPPPDAPTPDDAPMLASWSGHDWYADLGGEAD